MDELNRVVIGAALGGAAGIIYLYLLLIRKSPAVKPPSMTVVIGLAFLAVVGGLIKYSQIYDQVLTTEDYIDIALMALLLPGLALILAICGWIQYR